jgi:hypothetical protein
VQRCGSRNPRYRNALARQVLKVVLCRSSEAPGNVWGAVCTKTKIFIVFINVVMDISYITMYLYITPCIYFVLPLFISVSMYLYISQCIYVCLLYVYYMVGTFVYITTYL